LEGIFFICLPETNHIGFFCTLPDRPHDLESNQSQAKNAGRKWFPDFSLSARDNFNNEGASNVSYNSPRWSLVYSRGLSGLQKAGAAVSRSESGHIQISGYL
jgi:hypothetical protein